MGLPHMSVVSVLTFNDPKRLLETTDGNLSVHARKLEDAEYIVVEKYLAHMEALIKAVRD